MISCIFHSGKQKEFEDDNCYCAVRENFEHVGPYCKTWPTTSGLTNFCILHGESNARFCPGAIKTGNNVYYTQDKEICNKSKGEIDI